MNQYILAIDQGTSGTKSLIFNQNGEIVSSATETLKTNYLNNGFVEQNPEDIYLNVVNAVKNCLLNFETKGGNQTEIKACGISNQRETFVVWDKDGVPLYNAVVWQCKRSIEICNQLKEKGLEPLIKEKTGLIIDPYFSATKLMWLYQHVDQVKQAIDLGEAYFGTVDTWLLFKLTNGEQYLTDHTNASRTLFFNIHTLNWDAEILNEMGLAKLNLPQIKSSSANYGSSTINGLFNSPLIIASMIGDSHAAAFGEGCFSAGTAKATLGTGCSVLMNIGEKPITSHKGMVTTICWSIENRVDYALEGVIVSCGATIEWLKNEMGLFQNSKETEDMAQSVTDNNGVYLIPAFSGLGAPHWDMSRRGEIKGLTFSTNKNHIVLAALESVAFQLKDVILAMEDDSKVVLSELMVNGGMTANSFLIQLIANTLQCKLNKGNTPDVSALGAGLLAALYVGIFANLDDIKSLKNHFQIFEPKSNHHQYHQEWLRHIKAKA